MSECPFNVGDVDRLPVNKLFNECEIRERRKQLKVSMCKAVDRWYKAKYGDKF